MLGQVNSSNVSAIQLLNAANAFKNNRVSSPIEPSMARIPETSDGTDLNDDNSILKSQNVDEIKREKGLFGKRRNR